MFTQMQTHTHGYVYIYIYVCTTLSACKTHTFTKWLPPCRRMNAADPEYANLPGRQVHRLHVEDPFISRNLNCVLSPENEEMGQIWCWEKPNIVFWFLIVFFYMFIVQFRTAIKWGIHVLYVRFSQPEDRKQFFVLKSWRAVILAEGESFNFWV